MNSLNKSKTIEIDLTQDSDNDDDLEASPPSALLSCSKLSASTVHVNCATSSMNEDDFAIKGKSIPKRAIIESDDDDDGNVASNKSETIQKNLRLSPPVNKGPRLVQYNESSCSDESSDCDNSDASDYVTDTWSELEDEKSTRHESREAQEAIIQEQFKEAIGALQTFNQQKALKLFIGILLHPLMKEFYVSNWFDFDWSLALSKSARILSNMSKIYFSVNVAIVEIVENPVPFYLQALSIRPEYTDLWFECGQKAAKQQEWLIAELCFSKCNGEFRALESMLLLYFITKDYAKCVSCMQAIFQQCEDHCLAHIIRLEMSKRCSFWRDIVLKVLGNSICSREVDNATKNKTLDKIEHFRRKCSSFDCSNPNPFSDLIVQSKKRYGPLPLLVRKDIKMDELGMMLCNAFDRIEMFSSISNQIVCVREIAQSLNVEDVNFNEQNEFSIYEFLDASCLEEENIVLEQVINRICAEEIAEKEAQQKKLNKKKIFGKKLRKPDTEDGNFSEDELTRRRSTRFVEDVNINTLDVDSVQNNNVLWDYLGIDNNNYDKLQPFSLSSSAASNCKNTLNTNVDSIELLSLPSLQPLVDEFLLSSNNLGKEIEFFMRRFLVFFATENGHCQNCVFTVEQANIFKHLYVRWCRTFVNYNFVNMCLEDLSIHLLASELGSHLALSIIQSYFLIHHSNQTGCRLSNNEPYVDVYSINEENSSKLLKVIGTENKFLRGLFSRMVIERRNVKLFDKNNTDMIVSPAKSFSNDSLVISAKTVDTLSQDVLDLKRRLEIRCRWLVAQLESCEAVGIIDESADYTLHRFTNLSAIAQIIGAKEKIFIRQPHSHQCVSLVNVCGLLYEETKKLYAKQIEHLKASHDYEKLLDILLNFRDDSDVNEIRHLETEFLLIKCAIKTERFKLALEVILTIFQKIRGNSLGSIDYAKSALKNCIKLLKEIDLCLLDEPLLCGFGKSITDLLVVSNELDILQCSVDLWLICYQVAKSRESLDEDSLRALYCNEIEHCLPRKSLMVLSKAHDILGSAQKCWKNNGQFLRFMLDEMYEAITHPIISKLLNAECGDIVMKNVAVEAYQCLVCAFNEPLSKIRNHYDNHGPESVEWIADWNMAEVVLPLIMPTTLPDFSSLDRISNYFMEVVSRIFKFVLDVNSLSTENLNRFCSNPPKMELEEVHDSDGIASHCSEEFYVEGRKDPRAFLHNSANEDVAEDNKRLKLSAQCLYAFAITHYRNNNNDEALKMTRSCLAICGPHLSDELQSSAWFIFARCITNDYTMKCDKDLLIKIDEFLLPFKLTIFLKKDCCDAHLDLATIMYQIRTRIKRHIKRGIDVADEQKKIYHEKIEGMIPKCRMHFELARRYNDSIAEVPWLSAYFLAKIAEKLGDHPEKIFQLYYESAIAMEKEGYLYPQKIHRTKQINFEPLEIHYKVHSYAYKQFNILQARLKLKNHNKCNEIIASLKVLYAHLKRFSYHAVEQKESLPEFYVTNVDELLISDNFSTLKSVNDLDANIGVDVAKTVNNIIDTVDLIDKIQLLFVQAFETIFSKFPHYKACYRIAERQFLAGAYRDCSNTLFHRLFSNSKKRLSVSSNIFENIVEVVRADIERSGSFPYHIHKIIDLSIVSSFKCHDFERLFIVMNSLLALKNEQNVPDKLDDKVVEVLRRKCATAIGNIVSNLKNTQRISVICIQLQDLIKKMSRYKNSSSITILESTLQKALQKQCTITQKQTDISQQRQPLQAQNSVSLKRPIVDNHSPIQPKVAHLNHSTVVLSPEKDKHAASSNIQGSSAKPHNVSSVPPTTSQLLAFAESIGINYDLIVRELRLLQNTAVAGASNSSGANNVDMMTLISNLLTMKQYLGQQQRKQQQQPQQQQNHHQQQPHQHQLQQQQLQQQQLQYQHQQLNQQQQQKHQKKQQRYQQQKPTTENSATKVNQQQPSLINNNLK